MGSNDQLSRIQVDAFSDLSLSHGFYTRLGGVSPAPFHTLNVSVSVGDSLENVLENRRRIAEDMGFTFANLIRVKQVHSADVVTVTPGQSLDLIEADALVTNHRGLLLAISTADCVPILMVDPQASVIAAVHAGWGGALKGVIKNTVRSMAALGAKADHIQAAIGPCIHQESYEVGHDFKDRFLEVDPTCRSFFKEQKDTLYFDLPGFVAHKLQQEHIGQIVPSTHNTYVEKELFFSHRRATHAKTTTGRQLSVIGIRKSP